MLPDLNPVRTLVYIGREPFEFDTLRLHQSFNAQHRFELVRNFGSQHALWGQDAERLASYVGEEVYIKFEHTASGEKNRFFGLVTDVELSGDTPDTAGSVRLVGSGTSILLEGLAEKRSFTDMTAGEILGSLLSDYRLPFKCHASEELRLPYAVQYEETAFSFLDRLSRDYGEWFYYDGYELVFGKPDEQEELILDCGADVIDFRLGSSLRPRNTHKYTYEPGEDVYPDVRGNTPVDTGLSLLRRMSDVSDRLFARDFLTELEAPVYQGNALSILSGKESVSHVGAMLRVEAVTRTCRVKLGHYVNFNFPRKMNLASPGQYVVTEVEHFVCRNGHYENRLTGHPSNPVYVPSKGYRLRPAHPEIATVVDNADPEGHGRVKVRFEWQRNLTQTNWIRVQTPDGGCGDSVSANRGFVFVPEVGDQVMVGYEHGNPARPFVTGSLFHGKNGRGGGEENHLKSITTRSGHTILFDDDEKGDWGITIKDRNGNEMIFNTRDKTITISSVEQLNLLSKNVNIDASENLTLSSGKHTTMTVGEILDCSVEKETKINLVGQADISAGNNLSLCCAGNVEEQISGSQTISVGNVDITVSGEEKHSASGEIILKSDSQVKIAD